MKRMTELQDPKLSDWLWEIRERQRQRDRSSNYRHLSRLLSERAQQSHEEPPGNGTTPANVSMAVDRFLNSGKWLLNDQQISDYRMIKERERKRIVSIPFIHRFSFSMSFSYSVHYFSPANLFYHLLSMISRLYFCRDYLNRNRINIVDIAAGYSRAPCVNQRK